MCPDPFFMISFTETETSPSAYFTHDPPWPLPGERELAAGARTAPPRRSWQGFTERACQNVDAERTNCSLRSDFKRETCVWARAEMMRWCGHADALSCLHIGIQMVEIRMSSVFWPGWCKHSGWMPGSSAFWGPTFSILSISLEGPFGGRPTCAGQKTEIRWWLRGIL